MRALRAQVRRQAQELEILKEAIAIFSATLTLCVNCNLLTRNAFPIRSSCFAKSYTSCPAATTLGASAL